MDTPKVANANAKLIGPYIYVNANNTVNGFTFTDNVFWLCVILPHFDNQAYVDKIR